MEERSVANHVLFVVFGRIKMCLVYLKPPCDDETLRQSRIIDRGPTGDPWSDPRVPGSWGKVYLPWKDPG